MKKLRYSLFPLRPPPPTRHTKCTVPNFETLFAQVNQILFKYLESLFRGPSVLHTHMSKLCGNWLYGNPACVETMIVLYENPECVRDLVL